MPKKNLLTLTQARDFYYDASDTASSVGRQLALAGIAIVWLFGGGAHISRINIPNDLLYPGLLFISALAADLLQYLYKAAAWAIYARRKEDQGQLEFDAPASINYPALALFWGKAALLLAGYGMLASALAGRIN